MFYLIAFDSEFGYSAASSARHDLNLEVPYLKTLACIFSIAPLTVSVSGKASPSSVLLPFWPKCCVRDQCLIPYGRSWQAVEHRRTTLNNSL